MPKKREQKPKMKEVPNGIPRFDPKKYWEHPVYQHLSKRLRVAQEANASHEVTKISSMIQGLMSGKLTMVELHELDAQRREHAKLEKAERKKQGAQFIPQKKDVIRPAVNTSELKKRIFNPQTAQANMIKAFERLPRDEQLAVAKSLTPFLRSKIAKYLEIKKL